VAEDVTFFISGSETTLIYLGLRKEGYKIGDWVEMDWWLQNFCLVPNKEWRGAKHVQRSA